MYFESKFFPVCFNDVFIPIETILLIAVHRTALFFITIDLAGSTRGLISRIARAKGDEVKNWDGHRVMTSYRHQDEIVRREVHQMVENLTDVMALATSFLNPEMIVLGGGIMTQKDILLPLCEASFRKKVPARIGESTHIEACHFNNQAGIYGAYYNFLEKEAIHK